MTTAASIVTLFSGGSAALIAWVGMVQEVQTPGERYTLLALLSAVVLGIGGGGLRLLMQLKDGIHENTGATRELASALSQLVSQNQDAHRTYAIERDKAVAAVTGAIASSETRILRELERGKEVKP